MFAKGYTYEVICAERNEHRLWNLTRTKCNFKPEKESIQSRKESYATLNITNRILFEAVTRLSY